MIFQTRPDHTLALTSWSVAPNRRSSTASGDCEACAPASYSDNGRGGQITSWWTLDMVCMSRSRPVSKAVSTGPMISLCGW